VGYYSSPNVGRPPNDFFRLPFFGALLEGRFAVPFFGLPRALPWLAALLLDVLRFRPSLPPFIAFLRVIVHRRHLPGGVSYGRLQEVVQPSTPIGSD
jgi:hypothetical protein